MSLNWRVLPDELIEAIPNPPESARKHINRKKSDKQPKPKPDLLEMQNTKDPKEDRIYTFHNCQFTYLNPEDSILPTELLKKSIPPRSNPPSVASHTGAIHIEKDGKISPVPTVLEFKVEREFDNVRV
jgi:hypothetical protein